MRLVQGAPGHDLAGKEPPLMLQLDRRELERRLRLRELLLDHRDLFGALAFGQILEARQRPL
jgi:hypothetical protein